jgi:predicted CXXCH cytochrome family protein
MRHKLAQLILLGSVGIFVAAYAWIPLSRARPVTPWSQAEEPRPKYLNAQPGVKYVGSGVCAVCHKGIYDQFMQTEMGRSMSLPDVPSQLEKLPKPVTIYDKQVGRYFEAFRQGSDLYQSEYALDSAGQELFRHTEKLAFVVGTGANGFSYLIQRGDYLFQAPLSFYSKTRSWDLSPAHELGFERAIVTGCIVCHSGQPQPVRDRNGLFGRPAFKELAIGCERCHGPGQLHAEARTKGTPFQGNTDLTIVNPAKLPHWLGDNVCMQCHEQADARVLQPGKDFLDFRPGTPLNETVAIFKVPLQRGRGAESPLLNHYYLMRLSKCYRATNGGMACITCHDPHRQASGQELPAYYREKCFQCHTNGSCPLPLTTRLRESPPNDCVACHMPKDSLRAIPHSALTDHRIVVSRDERYPDEAFQKNPGSAELIHLNAEPGKAEPQVPPLTMLLAYEQVRDTSSAYRQHYLELLDQVAGTEKDNIEVLDLLARRALDQADPASTEAIRDLSRAVQLGSTWPPDYGLLAILLARAGRFAEAISILERGIALDPYSSSFYTTLAACYRSIGKKNEAVQALQEGLKLFPEDLEIHGLLRRLEAEQLLR